MYILYRSRCESTVRLFAANGGTPSESASTCDKLLRSSGWTVTVEEQSNVTSTMALFSSETENNALPCGQLWAAEPSFSSISMFTKMNSSLSLRSELLSYHSIPVNKVS